MIDLGIKGITLARNHLARLQGALTAQSPVQRRGLQKKLTSAVCQHYRRTFVPRDTGLLAASLRTPGHPKQNTYLTPTGGGWLYRFESEVPYGKYQAHRIQHVPAHVVARAFEDYLKGL